MTTRIVAGPAWPTATDVPGGVDVAVEVRIGRRRALEGTVTVERDAINGGWKPTGDAPDCWVEPALLAALSAALEEPAELRSALGTIGRHAAYAADRGRLPERPVYVVCDAPGHYGDIARVYSRHATATAALREAGGDRSLCVRRWAGAGNRLCPADLGDLCPLITRGAP